ncbi:MAG TPA: M48 family metalloprotease [Phenylobacterium sp.]|nr:M48 family metalloprotease [Phenylobacterium sp.]
MRGLIGRWAWLAVALVALPLLLAIYGTPPAGDQPLPNGPLKAASAPLLARAGVAGTPIVVRPGGGPCAWGTVVGLGDRQRIVVSPGALAYPTDQSLWTIAHEAGHVRRGDPLLGVIVGWVWLVLALAAAQVLTTWAFRRWRWWGLAALPLAVGLVFVLGLPLFNLIQRQVERRADQFGVEMAGSGAAAAAMLERSDACLGVHDRAGLFETLFRLNHPRAQARIAMLKAMDRR